MVFTFYSPWEPAKTYTAIKNVVLSMKGSVKEVSPTQLIAHWRTQPYHSKQYHSFLPSKFTFYVGCDMVRVVYGNGQMMQMIPMRFNLGGPQIVWNAFIESLTRHFPDTDFGILPGNPYLVMAQFVGGETKEVFVSSTLHRPSLGGAVLGGLLFGQVGAIIGSSYTSSCTTGSSSTKFSNSILTKARYSNGLLAEGEVQKSSPTYNEILVNLSRYSE